MMKTGLRVVALFAAYSSIGLAGEYAMALFAGQAQPVQVERAPAGDEVEADVEARLDVVVDVRLRHDGACSHERIDELTIPLDGVERLDIVAGSGSLRVEGRRDLDRAVVSGRACASVEAWLDELRLSVESSASDGVRLVAHGVESRGWSGGGGMARMDLSILVPLGLAVDIDDSSGDIEVEGTGDLRIDDSSGSIRISRVFGPVSVDDASGGLEIEGVDGDVRVEDGSGSVRIGEVRGSVLLRDGSGGIEVRGVAQDVIIEADGSGGIEVRDVAGDFTVGRDGSGGIRHGDVGGTVEIPADKRRRWRGGR